MYVNELIPTGLDGIMTNTLHHPQQEFPITGKAMPPKHSSFDASGDGTPLDGVPCIALSHSRPE